ncbi:hypothetical protein STEG23_001542 [Scotinomys teguina]
MRTSRLLHAGITRQRRTAVPYIVARLRANERMPPDCSEIPSDFYYSTQTCYRAARFHDRILKLRVFEDSHCGYSETINYHLWDRGNLGLYGSHFDYSTLEIQKYNMADIVLLQVSLNYSVSFVILYEFLIQGHQDDSVCVHHYAHMKVSLLTTWALGTTVGLTSLVTQPYLVESSVPTQAVVFTAQSVLSLPSGAILTLRLLDSGSAPCLGSPDQPPSIIG